MAAYMGISDWEADHVTLVDQGPRSTKRSSSSASTGPTRPSTLAAAI